MAAGGLRSCETVRGLDGPLTVEGVVATDAVAPVYNFSVEADHVYYAGELAALTHNTYSLSGARSAGLFGDVLEGQAKHLHELLPRERRFKKSTIATAIVNGSRQVWIAMSNYNSLPPAVQDEVDRLGWRFILSGQNMHAEEAIVQGLGGTMFTEGSSILGIGVSRQAGICSECAGLLSGFIR